MIPFVLLHGCCLRVEQTTCLDFVHLVGNTQRTDVVSGLGPARLESDRARRAAIWIRHLQHPRRGHVLFCCRALVPRAQRRLQVLGSNDSDGNGEGWPGRTRPSLGCVELPRRAAGFRLLSRGSARVDAARIPAAPIRISHGPERAIRREAQSVHPPWLPPRVSQRRSATGDATGVRNSDRAAGRLQLLFPVRSYRWLAWFAGTVTGYIVYDWVHCYTHHCRPTKRIGKFIRRYHMEHHYRDHDSHFGISSPLWDYIFGTACSRAGAAPDAQAAHGGSSSSGTGGSVLRATNRTSS